MKELVKTKYFWAFLTAGSIISLGVSFIDYAINFDGLCMDCDNDFGLPFTIYQSGNYLQPTKVLWTGLLLNAIVFGLLGAFVGVIIRLLWRKYKIQRFE